MSNWIECENNLMINLDLVLYFEVQQKDSFWFVVAVFQDQYFKVVSKMSESADEAENELITIQKRMF
jgi:hypothetical protein